MSAAECTMRWAEVIRYDAIRHDTVPYKYETVTVLITTAILTQMVQSSTHDDKQPKSWYYFQVFFSRKGSNFYNFCPILPPGGALGNCLHGLCQEWALLLLFASFKNPAAHSIRWWSAPTSFKLIFDPNCDLIKISFILSRLWAHGHSSTTCCVLGPVTSLPGGARGRVHC